MKEILNHLISKIRGEQYRIAEGLKYSDIFPFISERAIMLLRALVKTPKLIFGRRIFLGRGVKIRRQRNINFLGSVTLHDFSSLDGISENKNHVGTNFSLGSNSRIVVTSVMSQLGKGFYIGDNVGINDFCYIGAQGGISIGSETIIGPYTSIFSENHDIRGKSRTIRLNPSIRRSVSVGKNCWLGAHVVILAGSQIGDNVVVAAGAIVNGVVPDNSLVIGYNKIRRKNV